MSRMRQSAFTRSFLLPLALLLWLSACHKWVALEPPIETLPAEQPAKLRVTLTDGRSFLITRPVVAADSVFGLDAGSWDGGRRVYTDSVRIAFDDVYSVEAKRADSGKTALLILGIIGGVIAVGVVLYAVTDSGYGECFPFGCQ